MQFGDRQGTRYLPINGRNEKDPSLSDHVASGVYANSITQEGAVHSLTQPDVFNDFPLHPRGNQNSMLKLVTFYYSI